MIDRRQQQLFAASRMCTLFRPCVQTGGGKVSSSLSPEEPSLSSIKQAPFFHCTIARLAAANTFLMAEISRHALTDLSVCHFAAAGKQKTDRSKHTSSKQWRVRSVGKTKQVQEDSSDDDAWLYALHSGMNKEVKSQMLIDGKRVLFQLDTRASVNTLNRELVWDATMKPYHDRLRMWNNDTLKPAGTCRKLITNPKNSKQYDLHFIVLMHSSFEP